MADPKLDLAAARRDLSLMAATATDLDDDAEDRCLDVHLPAALARVEELEAEIRGAENEGDRQRNRRKDAEIEAQAHKNENARLRAELERVLSAIRTVNRLHNLGDAIYTVRENVSEIPPGCESAWEHPDVKAYSDAVQVLNAALAGGKEGRDG